MKIFYLTVLILVACFCTTTTLASSDEGPSMELLFSHDDGGTLQLRIVIHKAAADQGKVDKIVDFFTASDVDVSVLSSFEILEQLQQDSMDGEPDRETSTKKNFHSVVIIASDPDDEAGISPD